MFLLPYLPKLIDILHTYIHTYIHTSYIIRNMNQFNLITNLSMREDTHGTCWPRSIDTSTHRKIRYDKHEQTTIRRGARAHAEQMRITRRADGEQTKITSTRWREDDNHEHTTSTRQAQADGEQTTSTSTRRADEEHKNTTSRWGVRAHHEQTKNTSTQHTHTYIYI